MTTAIDRQTLIDEYRDYRAAFDRAPNVWTTPNAREAAGYCLQHSEPMQLAACDAGGTDVFRIGAYWSNVQSLILTVLHREGKEVPA